MNNRVENSNEVDKEQEVRKLQELVKKLELQNAELRSERHALLLNNKNRNSSKSSELEKSDRNTKDFDLYNENNDRVSLDSLSLEGSCRLSYVLDERGISDDETWLFDSPNTNWKGDWLKVDLSTTSIASVKKSLFKQLDDIQNSPKHSPHHSVGSPGSSSGILSPESPSRDIDSRTFIRPKKRAVLPFEHAISERSNHTNDGRGRNAGLMQPKEYGVRSNGSLGSEDDDRTSSASDGSYTSFRLADVEDVTAVARLQEQSLNYPDSRFQSRLYEIQSRNSAAKQKRVGSSGNSTASSSQEDLLTSPPSGQRHHESNIRGRSSLPGPPVGRFSSAGNLMPKSRESSDMSTPPESPYTSQNNLQAYNSRGQMSRLPNMTRRFGGSDPRLLDSSAAPSYQMGSDSPRVNYGTRAVSSQRDAQSAGRLSRLQAPQTRTSRLSAPSPVRIPMGASRIAQPGPPAGREQDIRGRQSLSVASRPASRLQAPKSRTLSQSPLKFSAAKADWREGCY